MITRDNDNKGNFSWLAPSTHQLQVREKASANRRSTALRKHSQLHDFTIGSSDGPTWNAAYVTCTAAVTNKLDVQNR